MTTINPLHQNNHQVVYNIINNNKYNILNKFISILLHVSIMIIFEIYFYFNYIVYIEKELFINKITNYINQLFKIETFRYDIIIHDNTLYNNYINSLKNQKHLLNELLYYACSIASYIILSLCILLLLGIIKYKEIKWKWLLIENIIMFSLLAMFEYLFFINVIMKYTPITDDELKYLVYNQILLHLNNTN